MSEQNIISSYTNEDAIEDGLFVDATEICREWTKEPFRVIFTHSLWNIVNPDEELEKEGQSLTGRLHDVFSVFHAYVKAGKEDEGMVVFTVAFVKELGKPATDQKIWCFLEEDDKGPIIKFIRPEDY